MKKMLSVLLSVIVIVTSVFIAIPASADSVTSIDDVAQRLGATEENLAFSEDFSTSAVTNRVSVNSAYEANKQIFEVKDGKWYIGANGSKDLTLDGGWSGIALDDFVASFEFTTKQGWGQSHFYYHSSTGWPDQYNYRLSIVNGAGYKATVMLEKKNDSSCKATLEGFDMPLDTEFNIIIVSKGNTDSAYIWKKGSEAPTTPTLTITTNDNAQGDMYYYTYQDSIALDNIKIYELTEMNTVAMETATGIEFVGKTPIYSNNFNTATSAPVQSFSAYNGTNTAVGGKWQTSGEVGTSTGLTGKADLKNFAAGFQLCVSNTAEGFYADIAYHSTTGWSNLNNDNRLNVFGQNGKLVFALNGKSGVSQAVNTEYAAGDLINIVLTYIDKQISAYIWKSGEAIPTTPTVSITATEETVGDLYFHFANATFAVDNFLVYDTADTRLYPEHIAKATGLDTSEENCIYKNDFNTATSAPVNNFADYVGTSKIKDRKWQTSGEVGTSTGLTGKADLKNFAAGFQLRVSDTADGFYADIAYHSTTGWSNLNNDNRLNIFGQGGKLTFVLSGKAGVSDYAATQYGQGDLINVCLTYIDKQISAYIWKSGEAIPTTPTISITATEETSGDLYFHFANATFQIDDFYVYNPIYDTADDVPDTNSLTPEDIEAVTGFDFAEGDLVYKSDFANTKTAPVSKFDVYNGTSEISGKKWVTTGQVGTSTGLVGAALKNFTLGFQFTVLDSTSDSTYADFAYHSTTGWANLNGDNRLNMFIQNGKLVFVLSAKEGQSRSIITDYVQGDLLNTVLTYSDNAVTLYLWKFGEALPSEPTLRVTGTVSTEGDIYFHFAGATFTMDDFYVYNNPLSTDQATESTEKTLIDKNFDTEGDLLFKTTDTGITSTKDGRFEFNTDGHKMLYSPLLADGELAEDFSWQFTYTPVERTWNTDRFKFHCQGDTDSDSIYLQILGSGNEKDGNNLQLVSVLNNRAYVLASAKVDIHTLNSYTVRIISKDNNISVYWWKVGTSTPDTPVLTAKAEDVVLKKGGFMVEGFHTSFYLDDMKLYNYADGKQLTTYLPELPENVLLTNWDFNGMTGKTDFPFKAENTLKYWQNTLQLQTPMKPERKQITSTNLVGDYVLSDLSWQFDIREFESWAVDKFIIHSSNGTSNNSIYLLFMGNAAKSLQGGVYGDDPTTSALRLIQMIDGKATVLGVFDDEIARGKGYSVKITCKDNNIEVWFGAKRTGKLQKVISAKADSRLSSGQILIESFNSKMWLDNVKISNCAQETTVAYNKSLYATVK